MKQTKTIYLPVKWAWYFTQDDYRQLYSVEDIRDMQAILKQEGLERKDCIYIDKQLRPRRINGEVINSVGYNFKIESQ